MRQLPLVVLLILIAASTKAEQLRKIFTDEEVKLCKSQFGGPGFVSGGGWVHVLTTCAKRIDPSPAFSSLNRTHSDLGDIVAEAMCIMKSSSDNGVSWGRFQTLSPNGKKGYASCKGIYDVKRSRLVVQYDYVPSGDSSKTAGKMFYQRVSQDNGVSWSVPRDITKDISGCDNGSAKPRMMAGNRIQLSTGRLLWGGESNGSPCFWFSDDGGDTYRTQFAKNVGKPNEFSLVETSDGKIVMNSRKGDGCSETNHRREYRSADHGLTWTGPTCSPLLDAVNTHGHGCQASITRVKGSLFFFNPAGPTSAARTHMQVHCSLDNGNSWPAKYSVSSTTTDGGYSDIMLMANKSSNALLLGFQNSDNSNVLTVHIGTAWCSKEKPAGAEPASRYARGSR